METELGHGEGDLEGEDFRLAPHELRALYRWFEYEPFTDADGAPLLDEAGEHAGGLYLHDKGLIGWPKGSAKTEFEAAVGLEHLEGPSWTYGTPLVDVAAVDGEQADLLVRIAGSMVKGRRLEQVLQVDNGRILQRHAAGRMEATTAALGKNDGRKPSLLLTDEIHEWDTHTRAGAKRHAIHDRNANKRINGRQLNVTTAGYSLDSLAGTMYLYGCQVAAGEIVDPKFLFDWWEASPHWDLEDPEQLLAAIAEANPAAGVFWPAAKLVRSYNEHKLRGEVLDFLRYHLNRWVGVLEDAWMAVELWTARAKPVGLPKDQTPVVLGFDGSYTGDSTALVGATVSPTPYVFVVGHWERDDGARDWKVPMAQVELAMEAACQRWDVKALRRDPWGWEQTFARLASRGVPVEDVPQTAKRMAPAATRLYEAVSRDLMSHDGNPTMTRHIANCRKSMVHDHVMVTKEHKHSKRYIDLAIAGIMAHELAADLGNLNVRPPASARAEGSVAELFRPRTRLSL